MAVNFGMSPPVICNDCNLSPSLPRIPRIYWSNIIYNQALWIRIQNNSLCIEILKRKSAWTLYENWQTTQKTILISTCLIRGASHTCFHLTAYTLTSDQQPKVGAKEKYRIRQKLLELFHFDFMLHEEEVLTLI